MFVESCLASESVSCVPFLPRLISCICMKLFSLLFILLFLLINLKSTFYKSWMSPLPSCPWMPRRPCVPLGFYATSSSWHRLPLNSFIIIMLSRIIRVGSFSPVFSGELSLALIFLLTKTLRVIFFWVCPGKESMSINFTWQGATHFPF